MTRYVIPFEEIRSKDVSLVGGKNASLGEMISAGIPVPSGYAVTAEAYLAYLEHNGLFEPIMKELSGLDVTNVKQLRKRGSRIRSLIYNGNLPKPMEKAIKHHYKKLEEKYGPYVSCAVRSSATAEDLPTASFAGQQETYLNVSGEEGILDAVKKCMASLFTDRAITYRVEKGFDHMKVRLSVGVQKMVKSDAAGVLFTIDADTGNENVQVIDANYGLGESVVQGKVTGDRHIVFKESDQSINNRLGDKKIKIVYKEDGGTKIVDVPEHDQSKFALSPKQIMELAKYGKLIHEYYGIPMDVEFGVEADTVYILQARPETVYSQKGTIEETYTLLEKGNIILEGLHIGTKIGQGEVNIMKDVEEMHKFQEGQVLVTEETNPDWVPVMKKASAIVTEKGGPTCHAAIVSRELGIPCIVGAENGMKILKGYKDVTVDCSEGRGLVYEGRLKFDVKTLDISKLPKTKTQIMMNISVPDGSLKHGKKVEGIGLARIEFVLNNVIGIHPKSLLEYEQLKEKAEKARKEGKPDHNLEEVLDEIEKRTKGYEVKSQFFVDKLAEGIATIAAGVYPYDTVVRFSDFKTNEYRNLIGGYLYEPEESNPMLGWRGASRYTHPDYEDAFRLECQALKKAREEMGLNNIVPMIPFNRTIEEAKKVLQIMKEEGLERGKNDLRVYVMAEIPSNIVLADQFSELFDGFSIGSNDLTQLTLGVDRDSTILAKTVFDERNPAVTRSLKHLIETAHKYGRKVGICGQAPSDHPEIVEFLVKQGIDSMSLNPDVIGRMKKIVAETEQKLGVKK